MRISSRLCSPTITKLANELSAFLLRTDSRYFFARTQIALFEDAVQCIDLVASAISSQSRWTRVVLLPVEDADWYYKLKAEMEKYLVDNKENTIGEALEIYSEYKNQISNRTRWADGGDNTTKKWCSKKRRISSRSNKR